MARALIPDLSFAIGLPPEEAIAYFKSKGFAFTWDWHEMWQEAHTRAFTVAKAMRMDVLQDIRGAVQKALDEGTTFAQFKKELTPLLQEKGWWGRKAVDDEGGQTVQLGSPRRLQTIYQVNLQTAYMAGRYKEQMENVDDRPYWQYVAVLDAVTRPGHRRLHGKVFRADDPFWGSFYPPNGWRCRCRVRALSASEVKARGLDISEGKGQLQDEEVLVSPQTGRKEKVTVYTDPRTGLTVHPDAGWSYNPGRAWMPDLKKYDPYLVTQYEKEVKKERTPKPRLFTHLRNRTLKTIAQASFEEAPDEIRAVVEKCQGSCAVRGTRRNTSFYTLDGTIHLSPTAVRDKNTRTFRHEFGHHVDFDSGHLSEGTVYRKAFHAEEAALQARSSVDEVTMAAGQWHRDEGVSDLFGAVTYNRLVGRFGHWGNYYARRPMGRYWQSFANLFDIYSRPDRSAWEFVQERLPELAAVFEDTIRGL